VPHGTVTVNVEVPVKFAPATVLVETGLVANDAVVPTGMGGVPADVSVRFASAPFPLLVTVAV